MHDHLLESDKYSIRIYPSIQYLEYHIKPGATIELQDAIKAKKDVLRLCPDHKFFVLVESTEFFNVTREARTVTATKEFSDNTICVAVCTSHFSVAMLGELYIKLYKPFVPTKVFSNRHAAKGWLTRQMKLTMPELEKSWLTL